MGDTPAPPAKADDPSASNDDDDGAVPPVLYAGWFYKKMHGPNEIPVIGWLLEMLPGAGWSRRYVRLFPGKLEWYKDDTAASLRAPSASSPAYRRTNLSSAASISWLHCPQARPAPWKQLYVASVPGVCLFSH